MGTRERGGTGGGTEEEAAALNHPVGALPELSGVGKDRHLGRGGREE